MTGLLIIAASGPSLTPAVVDQVRDCRVLAVNDAVFAIAWAVTLVASDAHWWRVHEDRLAFYEGARILPRRFPGGESVAGATPVLSHEGDGFTPFSCGQCSLFAAISFALTAGETNIALIGCDMRLVGNRVHYFGDHPTGLRQTRDYGQFLPDFDRAASLLPAGVEIINCTPGSALRCFPFANLEDVLCSKPTTPPYSARPAAP